MLLPSLSSGEAAASSALVAIVGLVAPRHVSGSKVADDPIIRNHAVTMVIEENVNTNFALIFI